MRNTRPGCLKYIFPKGRFENWSVHELVSKNDQFTNWSGKATSSRTRPEKSPVLTSSFPVWKLGVKLFIWTLFFMRNRIPSSLARKFALFSSACKGVCEKLINESSYAKAHAQGLVRKVGRFRIRSGLYWFPIGNGWPVITRAGLQIITTLN